MKDRVRMVMDHFKLTQKQFANELCVAEATISNIYKGRTMPTNNLIQAVHQAYPGVNINWLMFGEGEMLLPLSPEDRSPAGSSAAAPTDVANSMYAANSGFGTGEEPSLFSMPAQAPAPAPSPSSANYRTPQVEMQLVEALAQLKNAQTEEKPVRKIKEIRVFFDDGTFEAFAPSSK